MAYPSSDLTQGLDALEKQLLATWKHERLFTRVSDATRYGPPFVFFEGPPTANGQPGIHHVFSRTLKDLIRRYHTMLGQRVTRIAGWDTHGLPVEIEVEKMLNLNGKKDIEAFGVEKFNRLCRESVFKYKADWEALSDRIAYWLDYDHPYITYSNDYIETVWWLLQRLHEKALLYRGHKVLPYCPRCGTALSSHEVAQGYDTVQTNSVYVTFPLAEDRARQLVIWTTRPRGSSTWPPRSAPTTMPRRNSTASCSSIPWPPTAPSPGRTGRRSKASSSPTRKRIASSSSG